ncbi:MAG: fimbrillin family protein [Bacteroidales bacterium]|nr:fimbrillin family protein [Bacteroidales bacterium]
MKKLLFMLVAFTAVAVSCARVEEPAVPYEPIDPEEPVFAGVEYSFIASLSTKTVADGFSTKWAEGDKINIFNAPANGDYSLQGAFEIEDVEMGLFTGITTPLEAEAYDWVAVYPYKGNANLAALNLEIGTDGAVLSTTPSLAGSDIPLIGATASLPKDDALAITMNHLASAVALKVRNDNSKDYSVSEITLTFPAPVAGPFTVDASNLDEISYTPAQGASATITLNDSESVKITAGSSATFYAPFAPNTVAKGAKIAYTIDGEPGEIAFAEDIVFRAGHVKTLEAEVPSDGIRIAGLNPLSGTVKAGFDIVMEGTGWDAAADAIMLKTDEVTCNIANTAITFGGGKITFGILPTEAIVGKTGVTAFLTRAGFPDLVIGKDLTIACPTTAEGWIPDAAFRFVLSSRGTTSSVFNKYGMVDLAAAAAVTAADGWDLSDTQAVSFEGVELFYNVTGAIYAWNNHNLEKADFSALTKIGNLNINGCEKLKDFKPSPSSQYINAWGNLALTSIDLSGDLNCDTINLYENGSGPAIEYFDARRDDNNPYGKLYLYPYCIFADDAVIKISEYDITGLWGDGSDSRPEGAGAYRRGWEQHNATVEVYSNSDRNTLLYTLKKYSEDPDAWTKAKNKQITTGSNFSCITDGWTGYKFPDISYTKDGSVYTLANFLGSEATITLTVNEDNSISVNISDGWKFDYPSLSFMYFTNWASYLPVKTSDNQDFWFCGLFYDSASYFDPANSCFILKFQVATTNIAVGAAGTTDVLFKFVVD